MIAAKHVHMQNHLETVAARAAATAEALATEQVTDDPEANTGTGASQPPPMTVTAGSNGLGPEGSGQLSTLEGAGIV